MRFSSKWRNQLSSRGAFLVPAFCIGLIVLIWVAVTHQVGYERAAAITQREREQDNLARLFEEHVRGILTTASTTLREVETEYRRQGTRLDLAQYLNERPELSLFRNIGITDSSGDLVLNSVPFSKPTSVRDTENFQYHRTNTSADIYVAKPRLGIATAIWNIRVSRRMNRPDGSFDGNITVGLDPGYFSQFYDQISLGPDSVVSLVGRDGTVRARRSNENNLVGQDLGQAPLFRTYLFAQEAGHASGVGALDGIERIYSYRTVKGFPLAVLVGSSKNFTLDAVEGRKRVYWQSAGGISVVILCFALLVVLQNNRRRKDEKLLLERDSRYRTVVDTSSDGFWAINAEARLMDVNEAYVRRSGYTREELVGMHIGNLEAKETTADIAAHIETILSKGVDIFETLHRAKDGTVWPVEVTVRHRSDRQGEFLCFLRDITERKQAEEERKHNAETLKARTDELERSHQLLQALTAVQESIQEEERKRIARELHDELAQKLTVLKLQTTSVMSALSAGEPGLKQQMQDIKSLLTETIHAVGQIASDLRPVVLDELGLVPALQDMVEQFSERTKIECEFSVHPADLSVDNRLAMPLYRMVQESLTNVARHAEATEVIVSLYRDPSGKITLDINDNGKGLPNEDQATRKSFGLIGMRERVAMLDGELRIHSQPGAGTSIEIVIP